MIQLLWTGVKVLERKTSVGRNLSRSPLLDLQFWKWRCELEGISMADVKTKHPACSRFVFEWFQVGFDLTVSFHQLQNYFHPLNLFVLCSSDCQNHLLCASTCQLPLALVRWDDFLCSCCDTTLTKRCTRIRNSFQSLLSSLCLWLLKLWARFVLMIIHLECPHHRIWLFVSATGLFRKFLTLISADTLMPIFISLITPRCANWVDPPHPHQRRSKEA